MIEIIDGYVIDVDTLSYTLKRETGSLDKDGNKVYRTYGYYNSLKSALTACISFMQKEKLASDTFPLVEAIKLHNQATERFEHLLDLAIKQVGEDE